MATIQPTAEQTTTGRDVRAAWLCFLLLPGAFLGAFLAAFLGYFLVSEGLLPLLGQSVEGSDLPLWADAVAMSPTVLVFALPAMLSSWFARKAAAAGDRRGWVPAGILIVLTIVFVVVNSFFLGG
ncbi:MAG: hypothetical protein ABR500_03735 [Dermatophilaceae bacterium]|nr:hypothetical protein [Intrasporangiaceae bacterium]